MGGGTVLISLPKEWVKRQNIGKGSILVVESSVNENLLIYPFRTEEARMKETTITYSTSYPQGLINQITGAYLLGQDIIKIQGKERISYQGRDIIKNAMKQLVGLEIVEEDAYYITTQFLLEPTTLNPEKIIRRMHLIARGMYRDAIISLLERDEYLFKVINQRDDEVDRLYFLLVRLIRSAVTNPKLANKYGLSNIELLDYRVAANLLETVGDASVELTDSVPDLASFYIEDYLRDALKNASEYLGDMQDSAVKVFLSKGADDARQVVRLYNNLTQTLEKFKLTIMNNQSQKVAELLSIFSAINKIRRCNVDIADLVVPMLAIIT